MILVTGADGSVGRALVPQLRLADEVVVATDIDLLDVTKERAVANCINATQPDLIYHLAGAKHAPEGEADPVGVAVTNINGTSNLVTHAQGAQVILASTCKAANPETAYGASKLIAERMVLNAGGWVARFYNIPESSDNVFRYWEELPEDWPIPWTGCQRYFNSMDDVVKLLLDMPKFPPGRYAIDPGEAKSMSDVVKELYPTREKLYIDRRRGDRAIEPLHSTCERTEQFKNNVLRITSDHDFT